MYTVHCRHTVYSRNSYLHCLQWEQPSTLSTVGTAIYTVYSRNSSLHCLTHLHIFVIEYHEITTNTGNSIPHSLRKVCGCFYAPTRRRGLRCIQPPSQGLFSLPPLSLRDPENEVAVCRPHPKRIESLTIFGCHYKSSTFFSVL